LIQVLSFSGGKHECLTWSEKFLARSQALGKILIRKSSEVFDEKTEEGNRTLKIIELNEMEYIEIVM
jgi:hypothetical protein